MIRALAASLFLAIGALSDGPVQAAVADQAWVEMAPGGSIARVLTSAMSCPALTVDGTQVPMSERVAPATLPARANSAGVDQPVAFPGRVCERRLARSVRHASLAGSPLPLPLPRARIERIVVIGDTGCRLKRADQAWQGCNDPARWPFARIAARAAATRPDLVLHVGDYLYRENPCPADRSDCAGATWGYGEASWRADFLDPAAPLLAAAPWAMVRGNHETCARAGEGWWRLLDPHPLVAGLDCTDPANDAAGNRAAPYAVELGRGARLVIADFAGIADGEDDGPRERAYRADFAEIERLLRGARLGVMSAHYPLNPVAWRKTASDEVRIGTGPVKALGFQKPRHARLMIAGHVHEFQVARFVDRPTQIIAGFSGTFEDPPKSPATLAQAAGKPGAEPLQALRTIQDTFGYAVIERRGRGGWTLTAYGVDGGVLGTFAL